MIKPESLRAFRLLSFFISNIRPSYGIDDVLFLNTPLSSEYSRLLLKTYGSSLVINTIYSPPFFSFLWLCVNLTGFSPISIFERFFKSSTRLTGFRDFVIFISFLFSALRGCFLQMFLKAYGLCEFF